MKGMMVTVWHPDSPGVSLTIYRPWWRRKANEFASTREVLRHYRYQGVNLDHLDMRRTAA